MIGYFPWHSQTTPISFISVVSYPSPDTGFVCLPETCPRPSCCGQSKNHLWREYLKTGLTSSLPQELVKLQQSSDTENSTIRWTSQIWVSVYCSQKSFREKRPGPFAAVHLLRNMLGNSRHGNYRRLSFSEAVLLKVHHVW